MKRFQLSAAGPRVTWILEPISTLRTSKLFMYHPEYFFPIPLFTLLITTTTTFSLIIHDAKHRSNLWMYRYLVSRGGTVLLYSSALFPS